MAKMCGYFCGVEVEVNVYPEVTTSLIIVRAISSRSGSHVQDALSEALKLLCRYSVTVALVESDGEHSIVKSLANLAVPPHVTIPPGKHDGKVNERTRRVKDVVRAISVFLRFPLGPALLQWAVYYATYALNLIPFR